MSKRLSDWAPVPLRLVLGFGFVYHGFPKVFSSQGHEMFVGMLQSIGTPLPGITAWGVGLFELIGGLALIAGVLVPWVAGLGIIQMLYALFTVHLSQGFNFINITGMTESGPQFGMPGYEVNLLYIAGFAALLLWGAGAASVDRALSGAEAERGGSARREADGAERTPEAAVR